MRVTDSMKYQWMAANTSRLESRHQEALQQASTGRRVNAPSDDPAAAAEYLRQKAKLDQTEGYQRSADYARGDLELAEGTLAQAGTIMQRVRELTVQGSSGSITDSERNALAQEVDQLRSAMLGLANTQGSKGSLFGGTQTSTAAFDANGVFQGDDAEHRIAVGPGVTLQTNVSGAQAFTVAGGRDIFADLATLRDALLAKDDTALRASLDTVVAGHNQILGVQAAAGLTLQRLDTSDEVLDQASLGLVASSEAGVAIEAYKAYSNLVKLSQSLETSVAATRKILDTSSRQF